MPPLAAPQHATILKASLSAFQVMWKTSAFLPVLLIQRDAVFSCGAGIYPTASLFADSVGYSAFQASKPPSRAVASNPNLFSFRATRALVASSGQVQ